jgi:hypothetical protein
MRPAIGTVVVVLLLGAALFQPVADTGCTQTSQLALTRAFAAGTARIDRWQDTTCDKSWFGGHYYSVKAPGLAATGLPFFAVLRAAHLLPRSPTTTIWLLGLFTVFPAALVLAFAVGRAAERVEHGSAYVAATALGAATLALPFGTLWFGHVPAAALAFTAFLLVWEAPTSTRRHAVAGLLAGAAVLFEYPTGLIAVALLLYAIVRGGWRRAACFAAGAVPPAVALLAYNAWAFGSVAHFSYAHAVVVTGNTGHDIVGANDSGFFGITWPSAGALAELLVSPRGLLTLTPVCAIGAVGIVAMYRRARAEAVLAGGLVLAFLIYNAGYTLSFGGPFGGDTPGPRFLIAVLPFLIFPIGTALRSFPGAAAALLGASAAAMALATSTGPMVGENQTDRWLHDLRGGSFTHTIWTLAGAGHGWAAILPFAAVLFALTSIAVRQILRLPGTWRLAAFDGASAIVAWLLLVYGSSLVYDHHRHAIGLVVFALAALTVASAVTTRQYVVTSTPAKLTA